MPRTMPAGIQAWLKNQSGIAPVLLADIQTADGTQFYWADQEGNYPSLLLQGTRIQTSGGSNTLKYYYDIGVSVNAVNYQAVVWVKNQGSGNISIGANIGSPSVLAPGSGWQKIVLPFAGNGSTDAQIQFNTAAAGDSMDVIASSPSIAKTSDSINLIPQVSQDFSGWTAFSSAVITLTQGQTGPPQTYYGWLKHASGFAVTRDLSTNAGDLVVQNISGNTIDRDVAAALKNHEFEGALCIVRLWLPLFDADLDQFHGSLSEQTQTEDEVSFRVLQLFDPSQYDVCDKIVGELCQWRFLSLQCGSTGSAVTCDKLFSTCKDANHSAQERFSGVASIVPNAGIFVPPTDSGGSADSEGSGGGKVRRYLPSLS